MGVWGGFGKEQGKSLISSSYNKYYHNVVDTPTLRFFVMDREIKQVHFFLFKILEQSIWETGTLRRYHTYRTRKNFLLTARGGMVAFLKKELSQSGGKKILIRKKTKTQI